MRLNIWNPLRCQTLVHLIRAKISPVTVECFKLFLKSSISQAYTLPTAANVSLTHPTLCACLHSCFHGGRKLTPPLSLMTAPTLLQQGGRPCYGPNMCVVPQGHSAKVTGPLFEIPLRCSCSSPWGDTCYGVFFISLYDLPANKLLQIAIFSLGRRRQPI